MTWPTTNMYTTVERSLYHKLKNGLDLLGATGYLIFNNLADKKKFKDCHGSISIMKAGDIPDFSCGGGQSATLREVSTRDTGGNPATWTEQAWPQVYGLIYQLTVEADNLEAARDLENLIRTALPPRQPLFMWDSDASAFSSEFIEYRYQGFIPRDVPQDNIYNRVLNIRLEAKSFTPATTTGVIKQIQADVQDYHANELVQIVEE